MRNNGFVTDSDTERELRAWQTERETPIDEEKLRQQPRTGKSACGSSRRDIIR